MIQSISYKILRSPVFLLGVLFCGACQRNENLIIIDGSSTVYPISEAVAEEFLKLNESATIAIGESGTGGGFKKFSRGEIEIANASRPITQNEIEACLANNIPFIELPVAYDGLAVVVHPDNHWVDSITVDELKKIWEPGAQGTITRWNQIRPEWPDEEMHLYGAGVSSGTYDYFTEAIVGTKRSSRGDFTASEDDNVLVQGVSQDVLALGYFGLAYYEENKSKLKVLAIDDLNDDNGKGAVKPSFENVNNATYQPLTRPEFIYVSVNAINPIIDAFIHFYLTESSDLVKEVGYVPLSTETYSLVLQRFENRSTGSLMVDQSNVGVDLTELLKRP
jgi:phosphate transport system substrate-binding protein